MAERQEEFVPDRRTKDGESVLRFDLNVVWVGVWPRDRRSLFQTDGPKTEKE